MRCAENTPATGKGCGTISSVADPRISQVMSWRQARKGQEMKWHRHQSDRSRLEAKPNAQTLTYLMSFRTDPKRLYLANACSTFVYSPNAIAHTSHVINV